MSTNSSISIMTIEGGKTIYSHWDGYPQHNGMILKKHYNTSEKVEELISMGNVSILHKNIGTKVSFEGFNSRKQKQCLFYGRDRDERDQEATSFLSTEFPIETQEWNYLFVNGKWHVSKDGKNYELMTYKFIKNNPY